MTPAKKLIKHLILTFSCGALLPNMVIQLFKIDSPSTGNSRQTDKAKFCSKHSYHI